jgi:protein O-mannosyl-transferase
MSGRKSSRKSRRNASRGRTQAANRGTRDAITQRIAVGGGTLSAARLSFLAVVVVALAASVAGFANEFTYDDVSILRDSARLHGFDEWKAILTQPYWPPPLVPDQYRPLLSSLLALQYAIGDGAPVVFRIASYILYAACSVGVWRLGARLLPPAAALAVALLFAAHPVHVEAVAMAVTQNEILVALLAALMVTRYLDARRDLKRGGRLSVADWSLLAICYGAAALSKEQGLLLPLFPLLAEICLVDRPGLRIRVRELWKGFVVLGAIGVLVLIARVAVLHGTIAPTMVAEALRDQTFGGRVLTMVGVVPEWFRLLILPAHLRFDYSAQEFVASHHLGVRETLGLAMVVGTAGLAWATRRRAPVVTFGILWCAVALFPVSNIAIPTGVLIAERTLFLPSVGFLLAVGGLAAYMSTVAIQRKTMPRWTRAVAIGVVVILVVAGVGRSAARQRSWRDPETLMLASVSDAPRSWHVRQMYGEMLFDQQRPREGVTEFQEAIALAPEPWQVRSLFAARLHLVGADPMALEQLHLSLAEHRGSVETVSNLAAVLMALGRYEEARRLADSVIVTADAPMFMIVMRHLADSAIAVNAPQGSIRIGVRGR